MLAGFDFPIGLPWRYATSERLPERCLDFRAALQRFGCGDWRDFYEPARVREEIGPTRPFYPLGPGRKGEVRKTHLTGALGISRWEHLRRRCDAGHPGRPPAEVLFWCVGGKQVGKAAITGWRDLLTPAIDRGSRLAIWPFDGPLADLLAPPDATVVAEAYPREFYEHLKLRIGKPDRSKRRQRDRRADAPTLLEWAKANAVRLDDRLRGALEDGFGKGGDGEDRFDALVGLFGMLNVVLGNRPTGEPAVEHPEIVRIEGWILGQQPR